MRLCENAARAINAFDSYIDFGAPGNRVDTKFNADNLVDIDIHYTNTHTVSVSRQRSNRHVSTNER